MPPMKITDCFIKLQLFAELKNFRSGRNKKSYAKLIKNGLKNQKGGGLGGLLTGLAVIFVVFIILINIADYSLFTYKRNSASKAMDYAVTAAVQQISKSRSTMTGLANGFNEETGEKLQEGIEIDVDAALKAFRSIFEKNYKEGTELDKNLLICTTTLHNNRLKYIIKKASETAITGELQDPAELEDKINQVIKQYWGSEINTGQVYINGNPKTNVVEKGTYFFAYISDIEIKALYSKRKTSLSCFAGARIQR